MSWVRQARDAETLAGRGVRAWVQPSASAQSQLGSPGSSGEGSLVQTERRILIGNRKLMAEEGLTISRYGFVL